MPSTPTILVAEEDHATRTFLAENLSADGFDVIVATDKVDAFVKLHQKPDLVICDVNGETLGLVDAIRNEGGLAASIDPATPLIVISAKADALMRVRYLKHGCDDVLRKPFSYPELLARVSAVLRRARCQWRPMGQTTQIAQLRIDRVARTVHVHDRVVDLTAKEFALLVHLAADPGRLFTKDELMRDVWGYRARGRTRTLDSHAFKLRQKLRALDEINWVENVWGVGYRLMPAGMLDEASAT